MALVLKSTFLELESIESREFSASRCRALSEDLARCPLDETSVLMDLQLERLSHALRTDSPPVKLELDQTPVERDRSANTPVQRNRLELPLSSRITLSALASKGLQHLQQRIEEDCEQRRRNFPLSGAVRWAEVDSSDDDESVGTGSTRTPDDSDEGQYRQIGAKRVAAKERCQRGAAWSRSAVPRVVGACPGADAASWPALGLQTASAANP